MSTPWETEEEEAVTQVAHLSPDVAMSLTARQLETLGNQKVKEGYKTKAYLVLVDSDKKDWGIVEDTLNDLLWQPGKGDIIGTWSRTKYDNTIHISLGTAVSALQDRAIQTFAKYAEESRQGATAVKKPARRSKKAAEQVQESVQDVSADEKLRFDALRARLGGTAQHA